MEGKIKDSMRRAVSKLPQPEFDAICAVPVVKMTEHDDITRQEPTALRTFPKVIACVSAMAAVFALCCYAYIFQFASAVSFIEYRVNPFFEISVTRAQTLLEIVPKNKDAEDFLAGRNYKGWNVEKVVRALTLSMIEDGYLTAENNTISIRVTGKNAQNLERILFEDIDVVLKDRGVEATIISLTEENPPVDDDDGERDDGEHDDDEHDDDEHDDDEALPVLPLPSGEKTNDTDDDIPNDEGEQDDESDLMAGEEFGAAGEQDDESDPTAGEEFGAAGEQDDESDPTAGEEIGAVGEQDDESDPTAEEKTGTVKARNDESGAAVNANLELLRKNTC